MGISFECPYCEKISNVPDKFAGKKGKCPACKKIVEVPDPNADDGGFQPEAPRKKRSRGGDTQECKYCGETIKKVAKKCRHCGEFLDKKIKRSRARGLGGFAICPHCRGDRGASPVSFTWWGGIVGPKILNHVKCMECGRCYNGKTGKSNDTAIAIYVSVGIVLGLVIGIAIAAGG